MPQKRSIGAVTGSATAGGGLGAALAAILVHLIPTLEPVSGPISVVLTVLLSLVAGWAVPPKGDTEAVSELDYVESGSTDFARHEGE